ncbi:hypothetical protein BGX21_011614 [Mortierella sp. AD011]|nr:hypothetical protein BGX21_011614 [Mortierella sp. AD011]
MTNAVKSHLRDQKRPLYLQLRRQNGAYPWDDSASSGTGGVVGKGIRKRLALDAQNYLDPPSSASRQNLGSDLCMPVSMLHSVESRALG